MDKVTCQLCLVVLNERVKLAIQRVAPEDRAALEDHVRTVDAINALGETTGEGVVTTF